MQSLDEILNDYLFGWHRVCWHHYVLAPLWLWCLHTGTKLKQQGTHTQLMTTAHSHTLFYHTEISSFCLCNVIKSQKQPQICLNTEAQIRLVKTFNEAQLCYILSYWKYPLQFNYWSIMHQYYDWISLLILIKDPLLFIAHF